jgi:hypothetical protein
MGADEATERLQTSSQLPDQSSVSAKALPAPSPRSLSAAAGTGKVLPTSLKLKKVLVEIAILHYNVNTEEKH